MHGFPRFPVAVRSLAAPILVTTVLATPVPARASCGPDAGSGNPIGDFFGGLFGLAADADTTVSVKVRRGNVEVGGEVQVSREVCGFTTVRVSGDVARGTFGEWSRGLAGAEGSATAGARVELEMTLPNSSWDTLTVPDPMNPSTLPPGSTVILNQEWFAAVGGTAAFRGLLASAGLEVAAGDVVAITRQADGTVRLTVGPYEAVRSQTLLGFGTTSVNVGIAADVEIANGTLQSYVFDPSNPADLNAYRLALVRGVLTGTGGSRPHDTIQFISYEDERSLAAQLGPVGLRLGTGDSEGMVRVITHADGTVTYEMTATYDHIDAVSMTVTQDFDANGNPIGEPRTSVTLHEASEWDAFLLANAIGLVPADANFNGLYPNGITLEFDGDDWITWRDRARAIVAREGAAASPVVQAIANVTSAEDFAHQMYVFSGGQNNFNIQDLASIAGPFGSATPLPGAGSPACPPEAETQPASADDLATRWCGVNVDRDSGTTLTAAPAGGAKVAEGAGMLR